MKKIKYLLCYIAIRYAMEIVAQYRKKRDLEQNYKKVVKVNWLGFTTIEYHQISKQIIYHAKEN